MNGSEGIMKGSLIGFGTMVGTVVVLSTLLTLAVSKSADPSSAVTAVSCASLLVGGAAGGAVAASAELPCHLCWLRVCCWFCLRQQLCLSKMT